MEHGKTAFYSDMKSTTPSNYKTRQSFDPDLLDLSSPKDPHLLHLPPSIDLDLPLSPLLTDPEYIDDLWCTVRSTLDDNFSPLDLDLDSDSDMAVEEANLEKYGISILNYDDTPLDWMKGVQDDLRKLRNSHVVAWMKNSSSDLEEKSVTQVQTLVAQPSCPFPEFCKYIQSQILTPSAISTALVKHTFDQVIFDVALEPYELLPPQESAAIKKTANKPTLPATVPQAQNQPRVRRSKTTSERYDKGRGVASRSSVLPSSTRESDSLTPSSTISPQLPSRLQPLEIPQSHFDYAYWIKASTFSKEQDEIAKHVFVNRTYFDQDHSAMLPYLSVAFADMFNATQLQTQQKKDIVRNKLAIYGATALYNRFLLFKKALPARKDPKASSLRDIVHYGIMFLKENITIYVFECKEMSSTTTTANPTSTMQWVGCRMLPLYTNEITPKSLHEVHEHLSLIHDWGHFKYIEGLKRDINYVVKPNVGV